MASFKCSGCGRTDFFTSHGFAKHGRKCKGKSTMRVDPISGGRYDSRKVFTTRSGATGLRPVRHEEEGTWKAYLRLDGELQRLGTVEATDDASATARAIKKFNLDPVDEQYLIVSPAS